MRTFYFMPNLVSPAGIVQEINAFIQTDKQKNRANLAHSKQGWETKDKEERQRRE